MTLRLSTLHTEPPLFCHSVRNRLTLNKLDNFEAKDSYGMTKSKAKALNSVLGSADRAANPSLYKTYLTPNLS